MNNFIAAISLLSFSFIVMFPGYIHNVYFPYPWSFNYWGFLLLGYIAAGYFCSKLPNAEKDFSLTWVLTISFFLGAFYLFFIWLWSLEIL